MLRAQVALTVAALLLAAPTAAQNGVGNAANVKAKVDAIFAQYDKADSPGCALGVIQDGKLTYTRGYGMANLEHAIANSPALVYDIGSTSKQFTATSILLLAQQGKISLDDDVHKFIPELPVYQHPITIRHLLHHTSGVRDYLSLFSLAGTNFDDTTTEKDALDAIVRQKALNFSPGDEHLYSNSGYFLLSIVIERSSGESFPEFARKNIFAPLGMKDTLILNDHKRIVSKRATGYSPTGGGRFQIEMSNFEQTGDGAVLTSVEDLLHWDRNFYEPTVGGKALLDGLHAVGRLNGGEQLQYASGLMIDQYKGLRRVSHGGAWAGYRSDLVRFPDQKLSIVCLCNLATANPSGLAMRVADIYLEGRLTESDARQAANVPAAERSPGVTLSEDQLKAKVGLYRSPTSGDLRRIALREGKLRIDSVTPQNLELRPLGENRFNLVGTETTVIEFKSSASGAQLHVKRGSRLPEAFDKVAVFEPSAQDLTEFGGSYFSDELNTTYELKVENARLFLTDRNGFKRPLQPTFRDAFAVIGGPQVEFRRDAGGKVTGFAVNAGRIRNVTFLR